MFDPKLAIGQVITEKEVHDIFSCQTTLGIRMSKKNNLFVIMSGSAKKKVYDDQWIGDTLYYNGTDINSDNNGGQTLTRGRGNNNSQLNQVWYTEDEKKPQIFLFVKHQANRCIYKGEVYLSQKPFMAPRHDDPSKKVWIFPLTLLSVNSSSNHDNYISAERKAYSIDFDLLYDKVKGNLSKKQVSCIPKQHSTTSLVYDRNPEIAAYAKRRANSICDLCGNPAPFTDKNGHPYLESHHIKWLSDGGADAIENVVALCPNCHRKMHIINDACDVERLRNRLLFYKNNGL